MITNIATTRVIYILVKSTFGSSCNITNTARLYWRLHVDKAHLELLGKSKEEFLIDLQIKRHHFRTKQEFKQFTNLCLGEPFEEVKEK